VGYGSPSAVNIAIRHFRRLVAALAALAAGACSPAAPVAPAESAATTSPDGAPRPLNLGDGKFERVAEANGVTVFERPHSSMIRIGAQGRLPAPPEQVLAVLLDYPRHVAVLERLGESRVLERGDNWLLVYERLSLPVVDDRDFTMRVTWGKQADRHWIRYRTEPSGPPPVDGVVRITRNHGGWDLLPADGGQATLARYESSIDMAGALPLWMTRSGAADELPALFQAMCGLLPPPYSDRCRK
jgi:hypothetical protein